MFLLLFLLPLLCTCQRVISIPDIQIIPFDDLNISEVSNATCVTRCSDVCLTLGNGTILTSAPEEGSCVCDCDMLCPMGSLCDLAGYVEDPCNATVSYDHYACITDTDECIDGILHGSVECGGMSTASLSTTLAALTGAVVMLAPLIA